MRILNHILKHHQKKQLEKKINKLTGHIQTDIYFSTLKYSYFNFAREEFYKPVSSVCCAERETNKDLIKNKFIKVVPLEIEKNLTAVGLAY